MTTSVLRRSVTAALAFAGAVAVVVATPATSAAQAQKPHPLDATRFEVDVDLTSLAPQVAAYEQRLGTAPVPVSALAPTRATRNCNARERRVVRAVSPAPTTLRCWRGVDRTNNYRPQGITSTSDASATNTYDGRQALAVTSYQVGTDRARVTFLPNFGNENYQHIQLVTSTGNRAINCHAGGSVWYGHHLIVACTSGLKVFDWRKIYKVGNGYVMPQVGTIEGNTFGRFSSLGLDRASDPDLLVVSQYRDSACGKVDSPTRNGCSVFRFLLPRSGSLTDGTLNAYDAFNMPFRMQGAVSQRDRFWYSVSAGYSPGSLRTWTKGSDTIRRSGWTVGAESLSYWNRGDGTGVLLNVTEWDPTPQRPNLARVILAVEAANYP